ncbi:MAG: response regulator [Pseudobdellovibrionaceae bacterium]
MSTFHCERSRRFLVVDDDESIRVILKIYLGAHFGCEMVLAKSGEEAIEILKEDQGFDIVISDYQMSPGDGIELLNYVNQNKIEIPFIFYSGSASMLQCRKTGICRAVIDKGRVDALIGAADNLMPLQA